MDILNLEGKLLEEFKSGNKERTIYLYDDLFYSLESKISNDFEKVEDMMNYIIFLNGMLYRTLTKSKCCMSCFQKRNIIMNKLKGAITIKDIYNVGVSMIHMYISEVHPDKTDKRHKTINHVLVYIDNHLSRELSLMHVAKVNNISSNYLSYLFKKELKTTFSKYLNTKRMEKAEKMLTHTNMKIVDISFECGFSSQSYFTHVFKKFKKITPQQYRENLSSLTILKENIVF